MGATLYPIDSGADKRRDSLREVTGRLEDLQVVLYNTGNSRRMELVTIGEHLASWQDVIQKEKVIYETLNFLNYDVRRKTLLAEGWCPTRDIPMIQVALRHATVSSFSICLSYTPQCSVPSLTVTPLTPAARRNLERTSPLFFMSSAPIRLRRRSIGRASLRRVSRLLWMPMVSHLTRKSILVYLRLLRSRSCSRSCLVISGMDVFFSSLRFG